MRTNSLIIYRPFFHEKNAIERQKGVFEEIPSFSKSESVAYKINEIDRNEFSLPYARKFKTWHRYPIAVVPTNRANI